MEEVVDTIPLRATQTPVLVRCGLLALQIMIIVALE